MHSIKVKILKAYALRDDLVSPSVSLKDDILSSPKPRVPQTAPTTTDRASLFVAGDPQHAYSRDGTRQVKLGKNKVDKEAIEKQRDKVLQMKSPLTPLTNVSIQKRQDILTIAKRQQEEFRQAAFSVIQKAKEMGIDPSELEQTIRTASINESNSTMRSSSSTASSRPSFPSISIDHGTATGSLGAGESRRRVFFQDGVGHIGYNPHFNLASNGNKPDAHALPLTPATYSQKKPLGGSVRSWKLSRPQTGANWKPIHACIEDQVRTNDHSGFVAHLPGMSSSVAATKRMLSKMSGLPTPPTWGEIPDPSLLHANHLASGWKYVFDTATLETEPVPSSAPVTAVDPISSRSITGGFSVDVTTPPRSDTDAHAGSARTLASAGGETMAKKDDKGEMLYFALHSSPKRVAPAVPLTYSASRPLDDEAMLAAASASTAHETPSTPNASAMGASVRSNTRESGLLKHYEEKLYLRDGQVMELKKQLLNIQQRNVTLEQEVVELEGKLHTERDNRIKIETTMRKNSSLFAMLRSDMNDANVLIATLKEENRALKFLVNPNSEKLQNVLESEEKMRGEFLKLQESFSRERLLLKEEIQSRSVAMEEMLGNLRELEAKVGRERDEANAVERKYKAVYDAKVTNHINIMRELRRKAYMSGVHTDINGLNPTSIGVELSADLLSHPLTKAVEMAWSSAWMSLKNEQMLSGQGTSLVQPGTTAGVSGNRPGEKTVNSDIVSRNEAYALDSRTSSALSASTQYSSDSASYSKRVMELQLTARVSELEKQLAETQKMISDSAPALLREAHRRSVTQVKMLHVQFHEATQARDSGLLFAELARESEIAARTVRDSFQQQNITLAGQVRTLEGELRRCREEGAAVVAQLEGRALQLEEQARTVEEKRHEMMNNLLTLAVITVPSFRRQVEEQALRYKRHLIRLKDLDAAKVQKSSIEKMVEEGGEEGDVWREEEDQDEEVEMNRRRKIREDKKAEIRRRKEEAEAAAATANEGDAGGSGKDGEAENIEKVPAAAVSVEGPVEDEEEEDGELDEFAKSKTYLTRQDVIAGKKRTQLYTHSINLYLFNLVSLLRQRCRPAHAPTAGEEEHANAVAFASAGKDALYGHLSSLLLSGRLMQECTEESLFLTLPQPLDRLVDPTDALRKGGGNAADGEAGTHQKEGDDGKENEKGLSEAGAPYIHVVPNLIGPLRETCEKLALMWKKERAKVLFMRGQMVKVMSQMTEDVQKMTAGLDEKYAKKDVEGDSQQSWSIKAQGAPVPAPDSVVPPNVEKNTIEVMVESLTTLHTRYGEIYSYLARSEHLQIHNQQLQESIQELQDKYAACVHNHSTCGPLQESEVRWREKALLQHEHLVVLRDKAETLEETLGMLQAAHSKCPETISFLSKAVEDALLAERLDLRMRDELKKKLAEMEARVPFDVTDSADGVRVSSLLLPPVVQAVEVLFGGGLESVQEGDIILSANSFEFKSASSVLQWIRSQPIGSLLRLEVQRLEWTDEDEEYQPAYYTCWSFVTCSELMESFASGVPKIEGSLVGGALMKEEDDAMEEDEAAKLRITRHMMLLYRVSTYSAGDFVGTAFLLKDFEGIKEMERTQRIKALLAEKTKEFVVPRPAQQEKNKFHYG